MSLVAVRGWVSALFPVSPGALASNASVLSDVAQMTLLHALLPEFPPSPVVALLGVDNVTAVPEPGAFLPLALGVLTLLRRRRRTPFTAGIKRYATLLCAASLTSSAQSASMR